MSKEAELLPCPCCGGKAEKNHDGERIYIACPCGIRTPKFASLKAYPGIVEIWNYRSSPPAAITAERDACCRDICKWCREEDDIRHRIYYPYWFHVFEHDDDISCDAAAIRERARNEQSELQR